MYRDRSVKTLFGGERQHVWLAMLVARNPGCLLLEEPISALDIAHQVEVLSPLCRLTEERGLGVIIVLHDINMAARFCDEIPTLHLGAMIAQHTGESSKTGSTAGNRWNKNGCRTPSLPGSSNELC